MKDPINTLSKKAIETIDLATWLPAESDILVIDLKQFLFKELILKEEDFRGMLKNINWEMYRAKFVKIECSNMAIVPIWAYMLIASYLSPIATFFTFSLHSSDFKSSILLHLIEEIDPTPYQNKRVVIKGCGDKEIGQEVYIALTNKLTKFARAIMYGEPCSMVPIFKQSLDA